MRKIEIAAIDSRGGLFRNCFWAYLEEADGLIRHPLYLLFTVIHPFEDTVFLLEDTVFLEKVNECQRSALCVMRLKFNL